MRTVRPAALLLSLCSLGACDATIGDECDEAAARTAYYAGGIPAYSGQALLLENCQLCHSETPTSGAPFGLDFAVRLATSPADLTNAAHLRVAQQNVYDHRDKIYDQVVDGAMPPSSHPIPEQSAYCRNPVVSGATASCAGEGTNRLPRIDSAEGEEMLRNWLACGAPVVERTVDAPMPCSENADCTITNVCEGTECLAVGDTVPAMGGGSGPDCTMPEPLWSWIWPCLFDQDGPTTFGCQTAACHESTTAGAGLLLPDSAMAYANLVNMGPGPMSVLCADGPDYVIPGDPEGSLLVHKLEGVDADGSPVCGMRMPQIPPYLTAGEIMAVREWITDGATED